MRMRRAYLLSCVQASLIVKRIVAQFETSSSALTVAKYEAALGFFLLCLSVSHSLTIFIPLASPAFQSLFHLICLICFFSPSLSLFISLLLLFILPFLSLHPHVLSAASLCISFSFPLPFCSPSLSCMQIRIQTHSYVLSMSTR